MTTSESLNGVLPVDKPVGPTSHDIVGMTRRALGTRRVGHTGTLDPFASGLLLLCIGQATRIAEFLVGMPKRYTARLRLGQTTDTDDVSGRVTQESAGWHDVERADFEAVLGRFRGALLQVPSTYSAKKIGGVRAYRAARAGSEVKLEPVPVHISELRLTAWEPPYAELDVACSSGTYVRALARDIGAALHTGAHLAALRRTAVGDRRVESALPVAELNDRERVRETLLSPLDAVGNMPHIELDPQQLTDVRHGRALELSAPAGTLALTAQRDLIAIAVSDGRWIRPRKVFVA